MKGTQITGMVFILGGLGVGGYFLYRYLSENGENGEGTFCQLKVDGVPVAANVTMCAGDREITIAVDNNTDNPLTSIDLTWGFAMVAQGVSIPARGYQEFSTVFSFSENSGSANIAYRTLGGDWIQCSGWIDYDIITC